MRASLSAKLLFVFSVTAISQFALLSAADDRSFDTHQRVPWVSSRIKGTPDPPPPYRMAVAFPNLKFEEPLAMTPAPGTDRLFVVERHGKVRSFPNQRDVRQADVVLDLGEEKPIYGLAFHPRFASNGYFYITYLVDPVAETPRGTRVSRFQVRDGDRFKADPDSEQLIFEWPSGGHNGGCLKFGPDGYLYIGTGDSSGIADQLLTGQDIRNVSGAILRIDVDKAEGSNAYAIPPDNPFAAQDGARAEIWAYGLRQPWKFSFDSATGDLWTGNVGQDLWEQIFLIERGGNYGWSVMEGSHPFRPERPRGPSPFVPPIVEHDHAEFRSITGGFVYHGSRLPELKGAYIYGDYDTGKIWMFRYDRQTKQVSDHRELNDSTLRLVGFGEDHDGELYLVDHMRGLIFELQENPIADQQPNFPRKLSETGLFASVPDHRPAAGVIPYSVAAAQWSDGASKERFLAVPGESKIEFDGITYPQPAPGAPHGWKFPDGTVAVETLSLELAPGQPRRLETRILHYEQLAGSEDVGDQFWRGYTYVWNDEQTEATLLEDPLGMDQALTIQDATAPGGKRQQTWHFPSRTECTVCHNMAAKYVLGINTLQLNRDYDYGNSSANQIDIFQRLGLFTDKLPAEPVDLPKLVDYGQASHDLNQRARSYLHANCSHCHRKWGGGNGEFLLLAPVDLEEMGIANVKPAHGGFYIPGANVLTPGDPYRSVLFYRAAKLGPGRMPRLGSSVVDEDGLKLLHDWIASLPTDTRVEPAASSNSDVDARLATTSSALQLMQSLSAGSPNKSLRAEVLARVGEQPAHIRDLFERFLPEQQRTKRLGSVIRPEAILAMSGDAERGKAVFFQTSGVQCKSCHKIGGVGTDIGPDLSQIGKKYDRAKILENILEPSKEIDPKFRVHLVQTVDGQIHSGLLIENEPPEVVLKDAKGQLISIPSADVEQLAPQQQSMMPDLLLRDLTAEQVADLIAYLSLLKAG
ncbi:MAG: PQQ-dependent sugar dehydrogenase [Planctomycetota bacterium]|nr:PQQ-dependent sugar dehydrogenase [Planctomycetota bacterium]